MCPQEYLREESSTSSQPQSFVGPNDRRRADRGLRGVRSARLDTGHQLWDLPARQLGSMAQEKHVLAIASGGGHWQQLMRLLPAFDRQSTVFMTTDAAYESDVGNRRLIVVTDANRHRPLKLIRLTFEVLVGVLRDRPAVVISTGAAPGLLGIVFGRVAGSKTIWVDSIANAEEVSLSGRIASKLAHVALTQWPHLSETDRIQYQGSIL